MPAGGERDGSIQITEEMLKAGAYLIEDAMLEASGPCPPLASSVAARVYTAMVSARRRRGIRVSRARAAAPYD